MDLQTKREAIVELADQLGITVRVAPLGGDGGGIAIIKGTKVLFIDASADLATQCERSLADLAQIPEIHNIYVRPELREELDRARAD